MLKRQRTNVSSALNGNPKYLTDRFIEDFCKTFGTINPNWLITGEGSTLLSDSNSPADTISGNNVQQEVDVPSISYTHGRPYYNVDFLGGFDVIINDQTVLPEYNIDFKPYNKDGVVQHHRALYGHHRSK